MCLRSYTADSRAHYTTSQCSSEVDFMFMFRSRRTNLCRRLQKARKRPVPSTSPSHDLEELLKRLQERQLEMLLAAVECRASGCVLVPRGSVDGAPHALCCRLFRWPDLVDLEPLKRVPACRSGADPVYICCNPYHWSRVHLPDTPPPPYSCCVKTLRPEDRAPSEISLVCRNSYPGSLTTSGEAESTMNTSKWCSLAYWELTQRVGPLFPVELSAVNVFGNIPYGDGLSLETLAQQKSNNPTKVVNTRCKIGLGLTLSREEDRIWVYNVSDNPIFVNSPTLDDQTSPTRVPAEHCLCVYDPSRYQDDDRSYSIDRVIGPVNDKSIRISFVKGWGPGYSRQDITSCPCWLEILLSPCR